MIVASNPIHDYMDTIEELIKTCKYPLSLLIVGISNNEQPLVEKLDSHNDPLFSKETNQF